jgi:hypothetical protein
MLATSLSQSTPAVSTLAITTITTRIVSEDVVRKLKPCLPHLEKFDGSELSFFL